METEGLAAELRALAQAKASDQTRPKAARLRALLPEVEAALNAGASHAEVLDKLQAHGLVMTLATFNTTLRRLRAANKQRAPGLSPAPPAPPRPAPAPPPPDMRARKTPNEPADLDQLIKHGKQKE